MSATVPGWLSHVSAFYALLVFLVVWWLVVAPELRRRSALRRQRRRERRSVHHDGPLAPVVPIWSRIPRDEGQRREGRSS